jgi:hypothetical protein
MPAHQCPRCQLLFSFRTEVEYHAATDHRPSSLRRETPTVDNRKEAEPKADEPVGATARVCT